MRGYLLSMIEVCTRLGKPLEAESYREKLVELGEPDEL